MGYSKITTQGEDFITHICNVGMVGNKKGTLLRGKNTYSLPFCTQPQRSQIWTCDIKIPPLNAQTITTASELAQALIYWFNYYAQIFNLDANVIAAQAYAESSYYMWNYAGGNSSASGVNQFLSGTLYEVIVKNNGKSYNSVNYFTDNEVNRIINGLTQGRIESSYKSGGNTEESSPAHQITWNNRPTLHQNIINNPEIMIKAQCLYMSWIANRCNALTSSTLFGYSRGPGYAVKTYTNSIQACAMAKTNQYLQEGLNYVLKIFGVLGDKNNYLGSKGLGNYKPVGRYFGYDELMGNSAKNLKLTQNFIGYNADVLQSTLLFPSSINVTTTTKSPI